MKEELYFQMLLSQLNHFLRDKIAFDYFIRISLIILIIISIIQFPLSIFSSLIWFFTVINLTLIWVIFGRSISQKIRWTREELVSGSFEGTEYLDRFIKTYKDIEQIHLYHSNVRIFFARREYIIWLTICLFAISVNLVSKYYSFN